MRPAKLFKPAFLGPHFLLMVLGLTLLSSCSKKESVIQEEIIRPAKLFEVKASTNVRNYNFPAVVNAIASRDLAFQVTGQIETINVIEGQEIKAGDVIATLNKRRFENDLQIARTQYENAEIEFQRVEKLIADNTVSQSEYDQRLSARDVAKFQLDSAEKSMEDSILVSPFDGVIATKYTEELDSVSPSQPIVTLQTMGAAEAIIDVPASLVAQSKTIEPLETYILLDAAPEKTIEAEFIAASGQADERSQTFQVRFGFTPPENLVILPGMTGIVRSAISFDSESGPGQITIPIGSVVSEGSEQFVWVVDTSSMTVKRQEVAIGIGMSDSLVVESGLIDGDLIVSAGASYLHEGMKIRPLEY